MTSMTGYGFGEVQTLDFVLSVEVKSYNNRFLEIAHVMPPSFSLFEAEIDSSVKAVASRGRVEVNVKFKSLRSQVQVTVDEGMLAQYAEAVSKIEKITGKQVVFSFADLCAVQNLISETNDLEADAYRPALKEALDIAMKQFAKSRKVEGEATYNDLVRLLDGLSQSFDVVKTDAGKIEDSLRESLLAKFAELLKDRGYDEGRFLQEVAILLVKYSINEEICRLTLHITEAYRLINGDEPCGKKMDFLCQEMNREINTIGSKNILVEISQKVVTMKDCLENIREQIRNIE